MNNIAYCAYVYNILADYLIADALEEYDAVITDHIAAKDVRSIRMAQKKKLDGKHTKRRSDWSQYRAAKANLIGHKGMYKQHKVKGQTLPGSIAWDLT